MNEQIKSIGRTLSGPFLGVRWLQKFYWLLYVLGLKGMHYGRGSTVENSGEKFVLNYIKAKLATSKHKVVVFDVGANVGQYSAALVQLWQGLNYVDYCFEPSPSIFQTLQDKVGHIEWLKPINLGLSDKNGTADLYMNKQYSVFSSLHNRKLDYIDAKLDTQEQVQLITLDEFCRQNNITHIDFLKLDIEGHELAALHGAEQMLKQKAIRYIQFEFGGGNIDSRTFFQDFYYLLKDNYNIYRIIKNGLVPVTRYSEMMEIFLTINYLAELKQ